jgi:hypothetical protein
MFGIVAPRSLRAFEADSRQPDKEPLGFLLPAARLQTPREISSVLRKLVLLLACRLGFRLEDADEAGGRFFEHAHKFCCGGEQQTKKLGLQDILGGQVG